MTHRLVLPLFPLASSAPRVFPAWIMRLLCLSLILALPARLAAAPLPAFPGAEGAGSTASGGRGGRVLFVTNLEDYNPLRGEAPIPGSLRWALSQKGPRIVCF